MRKEQYKGCSAFSSGRRSTALYVCVKEMRDGTDKPYLYYFDRGGSNQFLQVKHLSIAKKGNYSKTVTMHFEKGSSQVLGFPPSWARLWKKEQLVPDNDCEVNKSGGSSYVLSCDKLVNQTIHT